MSVERKIVGESENYNGHKIEARFIGPDLLGYVDGVEMPNFYLNVDAAKKAGRRYCDLKDREEKT